MLGLFAGCGTSSESDNPDYVPDYVLFDDMDESEQEVFIEQLGMSRDLLSGITEDDLDPCKVYSSDENESASCELNNFDTNEGSWKFCTANWMSDLDDSTRLNEIIMPGSHDAGMSRCDYPFSCAEITHLTALTEKEQKRAQSHLSTTQNHSMWKQLNAGTRYFDIRLEWRDNALRTYHRVDALGFSLGCDGETFTEIMGFTMTFLNVYPSETVIIKLSHFDNAVAIVQTVYYLNILNNTPGFKEKLYITEPKENLAKLQLKDLRGKILFVIDKNDPGHMIHSGLGRHFYWDADIDCNITPTVHTLCNAKHFNYPFAATLSVLDDYADTENLVAMMWDQNFKLFKTAGMKQPYLFLYSWTLTPPSKPLEQVLRRFVAAGKDKYSIEKLANNANLRIPITLHVLYESGYNMPNIVYYDYVNAFYNTTIIKYNFIEQPKKPISDRYIVSNDQSTVPTFMYSMNQNAVMSLNLSTGLYFQGNLHFKELPIDSVKYFQIDKINWYYFNGVFADQWTSMTEIYPADNMLYWQKLDDFRLEKHDGWRGNLGGMAMVAKLPKE